MAMHRRSLEATGFIMYPHMQRICLKVVRVLAPRNIALMRVCVCAARAPPDCDVMYRTQHIHVVDVADVVVDVVSSLLRCVN